MSILKLLLPFLFLFSFPLSSDAQTEEVAELITATNIDSLMATVATLSGERGIVLNGEWDTIFSRHKFLPGNELAYQYLQQRLSAYGLLTDSMIFSAVGPVFGEQGKNLLVVQPGLRYPNQQYIICAHYDGMPPNTVRAPAADDNASSVAAVIEAARLLSQYDFEYSILYALWDEEEQGLVGSRAYAGEAKLRGDSILGVINMDAIAYDSDGDRLARVHTRAVGQSLAIADTLLAINARHNIGLEMEVNNPGRTYSDHAAFWEQGYGAVLLIEDFDNDGNPFYHTPEDKMEHFDQEYYHRMARLAVGTLAQLAVPLSTTSINELKKEEMVLRYSPNPVSQTLFIELTKNYSSVSLYLTDALGKVWKVEHPGSVASTSIDLSVCPSGMYYLHLVAEGRRASFKIVKI